MKDLYFMAITPDAGTSEQVTRWKLHCASHFGARRALTSPPHITLVPPFAMNRSDIGQVLEAMDAVCEQIEPFELEFRGFGCFAPRVIFIRPERNEMLLELEKLCRRHMMPLLPQEDRKPREFHPHMTIATKDLDRHRFAGAWEFFREQDFEADCLIEDLCLMYYRQGHWEVTERIAFGG